MRKYLLLLSAPILLWSVYAIDLLLASYYESGNEICRAYWAGWWTCFEFEPWDDVTLLKNDSGGHTWYALVNNKLYIEGEFFADENYILHTNQILEYDWGIYISWRITDISPKNFSYEGDWWISAENWVFKWSSLFDASLSSIDTVIDWYFITSGWKIFYAREWRVPGNANDFVSISFENRSRLYTDWFYIYQIDLNMGLSDLTFFVKWFTISLSDFVVSVLDEFIWERINDSNRDRVLDKIDDLLILESEDDYGNHMDLSEKQMKIQYLLLYIKEHI